MTCGHEWRTHPSGARFCDLCGDLAEGLPTVRPSCLRHGLDWQPDGCTVCCRIAFEWQRVEAARRFRAFRRSVDQSLALGNGEL